MSNHEVTIIKNWVKKKLSYQPKCSQLWKTHSCNFSTSPHRVKLEMINQLLPSKHRKFSFILNNFSIMQSNSYELKHECWKYLRTTKETQVSARLTSKKKTTSCSSGPSSPRSKGWIELTKDSIRTLPANYTF